MLSEHKRQDLLWQIASYGDAQVTNAGIAALANITLKEFESILKKDPEVKRELDRSRERGLAVLRNTLWEKAIREKNLVAIQFLAHHYLGMSKEVIKPSEKNAFTGELSTEKLQQMLTELDG
jgi:hypothetical protein